MAFCCDQQCDTAFCPTCGKNLAENPFIGLTERNLRYTLDDAVHDLRWAESSLRDAKRHIAKMRVDVLVPAERRHDEASKKVQKINDAIRYAREHNVE